MVNMDYQQTVLGNANWRFVYCAGATGTTGATGFSGGSGATGSTGEHHAMTH